MYKSIKFPGIATGEVCFEGFSVSVDPTFACVVITHQTGYEAFRYDEEIEAFVFVCSELTARDVDALMPDMELIVEALQKLTPWLVSEVVMLKVAWFDFFAGVRQLPTLTRAERRKLEEDRMKVVSGVPLATSKQHLALV